MGLSAIVGTFLSAYAGRGTFMGGGTVFMYFTIQSNIALTLICGWGLYLILRNKPISNLWYVIKFVGSISITLTGAHLPWKALPGIFKTFSPTW